MSGELYFWVDGQVIQRSWDGGRKGFIRGVPCVDMDELLPHNRIGIFLNNAGGWRAMPREELPPEFRATLLLMGVNP